MIYINQNTTTEENTMNTAREYIIDQLGVKPTIDPVQEIRTRIDFLKNILISTGATGFVLGISGGQDSTLAGRLAQLAVEELRKSYLVTFTAMRLPYGVQKDEEDAQVALKFINPDNTLTFNIKPAVDALVETYDQLGTGNLTDYHKGNVKARQRMVAQYAVAGQNKQLVIGTDQAVEAISGFFTKFGDGGADILPISGLTKAQGKALLKELGCPEIIYTKAPTADLLDNVVGQPDELELGVTYDILDAYLTGGEVSDDDIKFIETRYFKTEHKRQLPVTPTDTWWV